MILMEQLIEAAFRLFFLIVTRRPDLGEIIEQLASGRGYGVEDGVAFMFRSDWWEGSYEQDMFRPGYLMMNCGFPFVEEPYDPDYIHLVSYGEFCDRFDAYLEEHYYPTHPECQSQIRGSMLKLRASLGVGEVMPPDVAPVCLPVLTGLD